MLLVIDVGNSNIVAGVYDGTNLIINWRFTTDRTKTADEYGILLRSMFAYSGVRMEDVKGIIISSVVPPVQVPLCHMCERYFGTRPLVVGQGIKTGLALRYENPREIGADRIVNAVAAFHKYKDRQKPMIIIDFGTATTFCALLPDGQYLGGVICPGIGISAEALFSRTSKLPRVELLMPKKMISTNTVAAMQAGIMGGYVGLMEGLIKRITEELGGDVLVIATGGFSRTMADASTMIDEVEPFLTLEGLRLLYEKNRK